jgi:hypothetical protein
LLYSSFSIPLSIAAGSNSSLNNSVGQDYKLDGIDVYVFENMIFQTLNDLLFMMPFTSLSSANKSIPY